MYRNKKDIDRHVEGLLSKLSSKEFNSRAYSVARLYFEVGDYASCQKYVTQYLSQKDNNAAAHKLLGQANHKLGQKEKAMDHFKMSLDIDPTQTSLILDICELLSDDDLLVDTGRAKYWCEKAEAIFPRHPVTFRLREKLLTTENPDPEAIVNLLTSELAARPKDPILHARLLKHYLQNSKLKEAFDHSFNVEFSDHNFANNVAWYESVSEILKKNPGSLQEWQYQLFLLTVRERLVDLSLTETPTGSCKSLIESNELLHQYDQALQAVASAGAPSGFAEFHAGLLQHHRGQFSFHTATFFLKRAKKDQLSWRDAKKLAAPLMLISWHTIPLDTKVNWLNHAPQTQGKAVHRWYLEGTYRCSQAGHYILSNTAEKHQMFLDNISQICSGKNWRERYYEKTFYSKDQIAKKNTSFMLSDGFSGPTLRLPRKSEVEAYDNDAQHCYPNSLHHFVWILVNYKNFAEFKCNLFDMLAPKSSNFQNCGPETLSKIDIYAFLYSAAFTAQQKTEQTAFDSSEKPLLPANICDLLCPPTQMKWWDCAYKFSQNALGSELTDIRATLSRGLEVVRCIDNHGMDPELLCKLARIINEMANTAMDIDVKNNLETRAVLYYSSALSILEIIKNNGSFRNPAKRMFSYSYKELGNKYLNSLIEECRLKVAVNHLKEAEYDKAIEMLATLKSPQAYFHLAEIYKKMALEELNLSRDTNPDVKSKCTTLLSKARHFAYKTLDQLREAPDDTNHPLISKTQAIIEEIEVCVNRFDLETSGVNLNDTERKYSSDENGSLPSHDFIPVRLNPQQFRNLSSTPKQNTMRNQSNYRTAVESQFFDHSQVDAKSLERIEDQIKNMQKRDSNVNSFIEQTKTWFEENKDLGKIIGTINANLQSTTDQFKQLKISVDQVKSQIDECRSDCKDVGELKKQVAQLRKEVSKLKKASSEQAIDESDVYSLEDDYRSSDNASAYSAQVPFNAAQVLPQLNQRLAPPFSVPPNPYQIYGQNLYNFYNQYSQFAQGSLPGAPPIFDVNRPPVNFPGIFPTPEQMYPDMGHLLAAPAAAPAPPMPPVPPAPAPGTVPPPLPSVTIPKPVAPVQTKDSSRSLPVNVVITSSDPLPTCTTVPQPVLSVTIPPKHIKGTPHNYQIAMPVTSDVAPPTMITPNKPFTNWGQSIDFKTTPSNTMGSNGNTPNTTLSLFDSLKTPNNSITVVDGVAPSPNTSVNKSRTLSEKSNTSVDNYDPCPDFKPIVPLPDEVKVTTGEENETVLFSARAKLFRYVDKQWKERGLGVIKLLKHKDTEKVRVLMRREQVHKICANHTITPEMEINQMKNETKAYIWAAIDYADETNNLETFCVRFKTADLAIEFYDAFENARQNANTSVAETSKTDKKDKSIALTSKENETNKIVFNDNNTRGATIQGNKTVVGGFTFNSTPTFKSVNDDKQEIQPNNAATSVANPFNAVSFKTTTSSPFSGLSKLASESFSTSNTSQKPSADESAKLNNSDTVDEYEPTVEFKPVVPLPELVETKTGEEDETVLFEHRAKLLRFDTNSKEWKERGLGNIKVLSRKDNPQMVRLLMRREQVMKVCCNHGVTKDLVFEKMPKMDKAVTWCAKDFSEGKLVPETFCLRFKTVDACNRFIETVKTVQDQLKDESKAAKEEQNAAKQTTQTGFGDKFKPKAGSWQCEACYTNNLESFVKCACCEQPKSQKAPASAAKQETKSTLGTSGFSFGKPHSAQTPAPVKETTVASGWGDKFKPKEGTWECKQCFVRNDSKADQCCACNSPKDPNAVKKENNSIFNSVSSGPKFSFGIPPSAVAEAKPAPAAAAAPSTMFDGTGGHKFTFGIPAAAATTSAGINILNNTGVIFAAPSKPQEQNVSPLNFTIKKNEDSSVTVKPALLQTPQKDATTAFGVKEPSGKFDFVFKPKASAVKSPKSDKAEESDGNEYASEDEGHHIHFSPVVPLPDKIEVVTGEEQEDELYGHRAKLFRFTSGEWKERGIGIVKILKHKETGKMRVVMRREQVLKICLNHALTPDITYTPKDDKTWLFAANDFSEGELSMSQFCLRFKSKEIAQHFKDALDKALEKRSETKPTKDNDSDDVVFVSEIQATKEEKDRAKELMLPENFFTYKNKQACQGCRGCEADEDAPAPAPSTATAPATPTVTAPVTPTSAAPYAVTPTATPPAHAPTTPAASLKTAMFQSPFSTPAAFNQTSDTSIFRTPLESIGPNKTTPHNIFSNKFSNNTTTDKENTTAPSVGSSLFNFNDNKSVFGSTQDKPSLFGVSNFDTPTSTKSSILAAPKLNAFTAAKDSDANEQKVDPKALFGSAAAKLTFDTSSTSENKPMFSAPSAASFSASAGTKPLFGAPAFGGAAPGASIFGTNNAKSDTKTEVKSIFGGETAEKTENIFGSSGKSNIFGAAPSKDKNPGGGSIFGTTESSIFGPNASSVFGSAKPVFGNSGQSSWSFGGKKEQENTEAAVTTAAAPAPAGAKPAASTADKTVKETPFSVDNGFSFAALSSASTESSFKQKADFQWEGAGAVLFGAAGQNKSSSEGGAGADESGGAPAEDEYDPHYEPIVPLPDKITVTTGEEDEEKVYGERCKLYRFDDTAHEWKERGVGELKILHHPARDTYRMLLRREQIHKTVLNMLLFIDMELHPMKNSDRAWIWIGRNFAESAEGEQERLAVRFKSVDLAAAFNAKVVECVRKLQASAAQAIREEKEDKTDNNSGTFETVAPLRLPKHLQDTARADTDISAQASRLQNTEPPTNGEAQEGREEEEDDEGEEEDYEHNDDEYEDYEEYYNENTEEYQEVCFACTGSVQIARAGGGGGAGGAGGAAAREAQLQVLFDQELLSPKILISDASSGELLADMLIHNETEFQLSGATCSWSGPDFASNEPEDKSVVATFPDTDTAVQFYDNCETSKAATYSSVDSES